VYEITTIGGIGPRASNVRGPMLIDGVDLASEVTSKPVLVAAGVGLLLGLAIGAVIFGGRRG
jgi:hypothetical protein